MKLFLIVGFGLLATADASAVCDEPSSPVCVTQREPFHDQDEYDRCRRELEAYKTGLEALLSCLRSQSKEVVQTYMDALEEFKRRSKVEK
jgi:hypothetical protein